MEDGWDAADFGDLRIVGDCTFDSFEESEGLLIIFLMWFGPTKQRGGGGYCFSRNLLAPFCTPLRTLAPSALSLDLFRI